MKSGVDATSLFLQDDLLIWLFENFSLKKQMAAEFRKSLKRNEQANYLYKNGAQQF